MESKIENVKDTPLYEIHFFLLFDVSLLYCLSDGYVEINVACVHLFSNSQQN